MLRRRNYYKVEVNVSSKKDILENFIRKIGIKFLVRCDKLYLRAWKMEAINMTEIFQAKELEYFLTFPASFYINGVDDVRK